jgi:hypothetical protein
MMASLLFEIPVYIVSVDTWLAELKEFDAKAREAYLRQVPEGVVPETRSIENYLALSRRAAGYDASYDYNQIVGWIRVECDGSGVIKAYAFRIRQKRFTRRFKATGARHEWAGKVLELWALDETSEQIAAEVRQELLGLTKKDGDFPRRHVSLDAFEAIAPTSIGEASSV